MEVSIIIPTYNKLPRLKLTLCSLINQSISPDQFEVIMIDDGSNDGTREYVNHIRTAFDIKYINSSNKGRSYARNLGIKNASSDILVFIDDDLILVPHYLSELSNLQEEQLRVIHGKIFNLSYLKFFQDPTHAIIYDHLKIDPGSVTELKKKCINESDIINNMQSLIKNNQKVTAFELMVEAVLKKQPNDSVWVGFTGGNVCVPRKWICDVNGFDENFGTDWGYEDLELGYRLRLNKHPFYYSDQAANYHMVHYRNTLIEESTKTIQYFYQKHEDHKIINLGEFAAGKMKRKQIIDILLDQKP